MKDYKPAGPLIWPSICPNLHRRHKYAAALRVLRVLRCVYVVTDFVRAVPLFALYSRTVRHHALIR